MNLRLLALFVAIAGSTTHAGEIAFPRDFFVDDIHGESCRQRGSDEFDSYWDWISDLADIDGSRFNEQGTSLTVKHGEVSRRWASLLDLTYDAVSTDNEERALRMVELLTYLAEREMLFSTPTLKELKKGKCWKDGNTKAKCPTHTTEHATHAFMAYLYSAIVLREFMSDAQEATVDAYIDRAYKRYIRPVAKQAAKGVGFYAFANARLGVLAYANWTGDARLAKSDIRKTGRIIAKLIDRKGYINNNSWRGVRAYWYHTLGADSMLGYAVVAREHGVDLFQDRKVGPDLAALAEATLEGTVDYDKFVSKGNKGTGFSKNYSTNPHDARRHMHQMAVSLPDFVREEFGIEVPTAGKYDRLVRDESVDRFIGFNAACFYESRARQGQIARGQVTSASKQGASSGATSGADR